MNHPVDSNPSDWNWLKDTYWYVPPGSLPALQMDDDTLSWVIDQTVWHITGYRDGYFWGVSATLIRRQGEQDTPKGRGPGPVCFSMFGSITPEAQIHLTFIVQRKMSSSPPTIGIGRAIQHQAVDHQGLPHQDGWSLEMQMSSGDRTQTAHWASMTRVRPGDPAWETLPGVDLSVPEMLGNCKPPDTTERSQSPIQPGGPQQG